MSDLFETKVATFGPDLMRDLRLTAEQAAGLLGNLGHESGGFRFMQEQGRRRGSGGLGLAQWTGPRRRAFEQWCAQHGVPTSSDAGNIGYLLFELKGAYAGTVTSLQRCATVDAATRSFCNSFERPGIPAMSSRLAYARRALAVIHPGHPAAVAPPPRAARRPVTDKHNIGRHRRG